MDSSSATPSVGRRRGGNYAALIVLNVALLGLLALVTLAPEADAQGRGRSDYTMIAGNVNGSDAAATYIVDTINQDLVVMLYNTSTKKLDGVAYRNLADDTARILQGGGGR